MAREVLDAIRQAEAEAQRLTQEAQQSAREMVSAAEKSCRDRERQADQARAATKLKLVEEEGRAFREGIEAKLPEIKALREKQLEAARAKLPQAADYIVQKVLGDGNR